MVCAKLYTGEFIKCDTTIYAKPPFVIVDSKKFNENEVEFYVNSVGFYANSRKIRNTKKSFFMKATDYGKINFYEKTEIRSEYINGELHSVGGSNWDGILRNDMCYNIGYGPLKKANYRNMNSDMKMNPNCVKTLNEYRNIGLMQYSCYALSAASVLYGVSTLIKGKNQEIGITAVVVSCSVAFYGNYALKMLKYEKIEKLMKSYSFDKL